MTPFDAIRFVGTPIALVAFIVAVAAYAYRASLVGRRKLIETAPAEDRARLLDATIRDFTTVPTDTLTREQRYLLALRLIEERAGRFRTTAVVGVLVAVILAAAVALVTLRVPAAAAAVGLTVRVHGPGGPQDVVTTGTVTLATGADLDTRPVGPEGQVRFGDVPRAELARATLIANVPGYAAVGGTSLAELERGVAYLELAPLSTRVYGSVVDPERAPLPGVALTFDGGQAVDTTDESGSFSVTLPAPPGARVPVRAVRDGAVGYNDMITIPDAAALTLFFEPGSGS